jgi:KUP system potassium uptake protein
VPWIADEERVACDPLGHDCWRVRARYGFMDAPDVSLALELCAAHGLACEPMDTSYFLSREKILAVAGGAGMALWRERLFAALARNAGSITDYFNIPSNRVVELGMQVEI